MPVSSSLGNSDLRTDAICAIQSIACCARAPFDVVYRSRKSFVVAGSRITAHQLTGACPLPVLFFDSSGAVPMKSKDRHSRESAKACSFSLALTSNGNGWRRGLVLVIKLNIVYQKQ